MWRISAAESTAAASVAKGQSVNVPTCLADDAVRDLGGIFADLAMPAVVAFAGPSVLIHFYALSILERHHLS